MGKGWAGKIKWQVCAKKKGFKYGYESLFNSWFWGVDICRIYQHLRR